MATSSGRYVGIDVSKDRLDVAMLGGQCKSVDNSQKGIESLVGQTTELRPALIVVEATGGYQRGVVEGLFAAGLAVAVVNPARVRQFARACGLLAKTDNWMLWCWQSLGERCSPGAMKAKAKREGS
jgi:transposase